MGNSSTEDRPVFKAHPSVQAFSVSPPVFLTRHFPPSSPSDDASQPPAPVFLATGAIVFDRPLPNNDLLHPAPAGVDLSASAGAGARHATTPPRVLLVQRAAHDSTPLRWETPGGGCDDDDASVLHSCARELFEEAGLHATTLGPVVRVGSVSDSPEGGGRGGASAEEQGHEWRGAMGAQFFRTRRGKLVCKFYFVAGVPEERTGEVVVDPKEHAGYVWATEEEVRRKRVQGEGGGLELEFTTQVQWEVILTAFGLWHASG